MCVIPQAEMPLPDDQGPTTFAEFTKHPKLSYPVDEMVPQKRALLRPLSFPSSVPLLFCHGKAQLHTRAYVLKVPCPQVFVLFAQLR